MVSGHWHCRNSGKRMARKSHSWNIVKIIRALRQTNHQNACCPYSLHLLRLAVVCVAEGQQNQNNLVAIRD